MANTGSKTYVVGTSPTCIFEMTYTASNYNNTQLKIDCKLEISIANSKNQPATTEEMKKFSAHIFPTYSGKTDFKFNSTTKSVVTKETSEQWGFNGSTWGTNTNPMKTIEFSVICDKTTSGNIPFSATSASTGSGQGIPEGLKLAVSSDTITTDIKLDNKPTTPSNVRATCDSNSNFENSSNVTWTGSTVDGATISHYILSYSVNNGSYTDINAGNKTSYTFSSNLYGSGFKFKVKAVSSTGKESDYSSESNTVYRLNYPDAPKNFTINKDKQYFELAYTANSSIELLWTKPTDKTRSIIDHYEIEMGYLKVDENNNTEFNYTDSNNYRNYNVKNVTSLAINMYNYYKGVYTGRNLYCARIRAVDTYGTKSSVVYLNTADYLSENYTVFSKNINRVIFAKKLDVRPSVLGNSISLDNGSLKTFLTGTFIENGSEVSKTIECNSYYIYKTDNTYYLKNTIANKKLAVMAIPIGIDNNLTETSTQEMIMEYIDTQLGEVYTSDSSSNYDLEIVSQGSMGTYDFEYFLLCYLTKEEANTAKFSNYKSGILYSEFETSSSFNNKNTIKYDNLYYYKLNSSLSDPVFIYCDKNSTIIPSESIEKRNGIDYFDKPIRLDIENYIDEETYGTYATKQLTIIDEEGNTSVIMEDYNKLDLIDVSGNYFMSCCNKISFTNHYNYTVEYLSDTNTKIFYLDSSSKSELIIPELSVTTDFKNLPDGSSIQSATVKAELENDSVHYYRIVETDTFGTSTDISLNLLSGSSITIDGETYYTSNNETVSKLYDTFKNDVLNIGYTFIVYVYNNICKLKSYSSINFEIFKIPAKTKELISSKIYHDSNADDKDDTNRIHPLFDNDTRCNDIVITFKDNSNTDGSLYIVNYNGNKFIVNNKFNFALLKNEFVNLNVKEYQIKNTDHYHNNENASGINNFTDTSVYDHFLVGEENFLTDVINQTIVPKEAPVIKVNYREDFKLVSDDEYEEYLVDNNNPISFSIIQENTDINYDDYKLVCYIDGRPYTPNTKYATTGNHIFHAFYKDRHNYTLSESKFLFRLIKKDIGTVPFIDYDPKNEFAENMTITISWYINKEEEEPYIKKKEYKIDNNVYTTDPEWNDDGNWKTYTEPFIITDNCTIHAKKTMTDGNILKSQLTIEKLIDNTPPDIPVISDFVTDISKSANSSIYIPSINKVLGCSYKFYINGLPYEEGTPITNYDRNIRDFILGVSVTNNYNHKTTYITKKIKIDTIPPNKPILKDISNNSIINIDKDYTLELSNYEDNVEYSITLDGDNLILDKDNKVKPFEKMTVKEFNKSHVLIISAKKTTNGMSNSSYYYFDVNESVNTDEMHTLNKTRNVLIPLSSETGFYEYSKELVIDDRTGDICITNTIKDSNGSYGLVNLTKEIKENIYEINNILGQYAKMTNIHFEELRYLKNSIEYIIDNDIEIKELLDEVTKIIEDLEEESKKVTEIVNTTKDKITQYETKYDDFKSKYENDFKNLISYLTNTIENKISVTKENTVTSIYEMYQNASEVIKQMFNLKNIETEANKKVSQTDFNNFKNKHDKAYNELKSKLENFSKDNVWSW